MKKTPKTAGIYQITNKVNGKFYIGSTLNFRHRWTCHKCNLRLKRKCSNPKLQAAWNKYGEDNFEFTVLLECPDEHLIDCEQWYIDNLKPTYNIRGEADTNRGFRHSSETRQKIGDASVELWKTKKLTEACKKPILCYNTRGEFIKEFDSAKTASVELEMFSTNITRVLKGKVETAKGYHFRYKLSDEIEPSVILKRTNTIVHLLGEKKSRTEYMKDYKNRLKMKNNEKE